MKEFVAERPFGDPDAAARRLNRDRERRRSRAGRSDLHRAGECAVLAVGGTGDDFRAGIECAIALGWIWMHESGTYVKFTDAGAALFA